MSQLPSADRSPPGTKPATAPAVAPAFDAEMHAFWARNRGLILLVCVAVLLAITAREGFRYFSVMHEQSIREEYAKVADSPDRLAGFAEDHPGHALAGIAYLKLADQKFESGDYRSATPLYTKAAGSLTNEALLGRARLGAAVSQISGGDQAGGEAALKVISADQAVFKDVRAEATYHLATLALEAGRTEDVKKLVEEVTKIDLTGAWSQRATLLLAGLPAGDTPAAANASGLSFKPGQ
jgi:hypothetical protein